MLYEQRWTKFEKRGRQGKSKERPIRYASRRDAAIFGYYRHILAAKYEEQLKEVGLTDNILAYRRVLGAGGRGKSNIDFAYEAFCVARNLGNCCAVALDVSSFFESIDHQQLKRRWCDLLGVAKLPADHFKVFEAITSYSAVNRLSVYERLGFVGPKRKARDGTDIVGYLRRREDIPVQLCTGDQFRATIAGGGGSKSLITTNRKPYGIPRGSPISDLLANVSLFEFDRAVAQRVNALGGRYFRYSDDILIVAPISSSQALELEEWVRFSIADHGPKLKIKPEKSAVFEYLGTGSDQTWQHVMGQQGRNGLEYLGFRYDGRKIFLRNSTISNLHRKAAASAKRLAYSLVRQYPGKSAGEILDAFNLSAFIQRFGRVREFETKAYDIRNWTFWTYARRASAAMGTLGTPIHGQLRNHRRHLHEHIRRALERRLGTSS